jgi:anti-sigma factor RsiW
VQCAERLRAQAYFDGEVDALAAADMERHVETCAECHALLEDLERMRTAIRELTPARATPALRARILRALDEEVAVAAHAAARETKIAAPRALRGRSTWRTRAFWTGAFGGVAGTAVAATLAFFLLLPGLGQPMLDELVAAHVRSLMPTHLIDVESTDHHTVKPWFAGHADVSPVVADFTQQGYRLIGGRADYLDHQRAAVVVYQHGPHIINVFSWAAGQRSATKNTTRSGYRIACWRAADLQYCAVSDTGWDELRGLLRLLQTLSADDLKN